MSDYQIKYKNISIGNTYKFNINKSFFSLFDKSEITDVEIEANVILNKKDHRDSLALRLVEILIICYDSRSSKYHYRFLLHLTS